ncbi:anaerobic glycerol-3-phosphate dehydrogenase subunit C [Marinomonas sp. MED121]|uniref:RebB family R body protein n=1 Tax=Marinomonas sp. MED121 TaxID=314277 RepID=UPI0000690A3E|nr:RebB family R body protein [Marinomonas sp. MED121]EAQ64004.1 anaerobic glycerol-3-phosphate dehydrogenase subunit C [Marinomonas sp. MED121]
MPNQVNEAITDSVTQVNTKVLGDTPATAMGNLMLATSQALAAGAQNLTTGQQQANVMWQAATVQGINALMNTGNAVTGTVSGQIIDKGEAPRR